MTDSIKEMLEELRELDLTAGVLAEDLKGVKEVMAHLRSAIADKMLSGDNPVRSIDNDLARVTIKNAPVKVRITNKDMLPEQVYKSVPKIDEPLLKALLSQGSVEGAELVPGGATVSIQWRK